MYIQKHIRFKERNKMLLYFLLHNFLNLKYKSWTSFYISMDKILQCLTVSEKAICECTII